VAIVQSLPGVGRKITAWLFAEAAQPLAERDYQVLRTHGGVAPVTKQRGKRRQVVMRRGCNPRLRHALSHMVRVAMQRNAHFSSVYAAVQGEGAAAWPGLTPYWRPPTAYPDGHVASSYVL
jgi:hypothetical protein